MRTIVFIDAANLFYGGEKSLGWRIDYRRLFSYFYKKYSASKAFYFAGVEIDEFPYDYIRYETVPLEEVAKYFEDRADNLLRHCLQRIKFYERLNQFGYNLYLKPVKVYKQEDGAVRRKANCDVDMAFHLMKESSNFDRAVILSGDGDFLPVLKYLRSLGKEVVVLARASRTAREIRQFAGSNFRDFEYLRELVRTL